MKAAPTSSANRVPPRDAVRVEDLVLAVALALALAAPMAARAQTFHLFPESVSPAHYFAEPGQPEGIEPFASGLAFPLDGYGYGVSRPMLPPDLLSPGTPRARVPLFTPATTLTTAVVVGGVTLGLGLVGVHYGYGQPFGFTAEKYFGKDTYAGGADKCSHFILSAVFTRELGWIYEQQGHSRDVSLALSAGVISLIGVLQEVEDGLTSFGFSGEDVSADVAGALTGAALTHFGLNDLIGIRYGLVPDGVPENSCCVPFHGSNYDNEIYSGDLKLAGLARRLRFDAGPARFLLISATYSVRAYGYEPARPERQRNVGVDVGLNLPEILTAVGVPKTTWWGIALYKVLDFVRIPFTAFGVRYDLNHKKWHGPDTGQKFD